MLQLKPKSEKNLTSTVTKHIYSKCNILTHIIKDYYYIYHITLISKLYEVILWVTAIGTSLEAGEWKYFFPRTVQILKFPLSLIRLTIYLNAQNQQQ